jgi:hypothetical protein
MYEEFILINTGLPRLPTLQLPDRAKPSNDSAIKLFPERDPEKPEPVLRQKTFWKLPARVAL